MSTIQLLQTREGFFCKHLQHFTDQQLCKGIYGQASLKNF